jgi:PAS domain S-box-containing protein
MIESFSPATVLTALLEALESAGIGCTVVLDHGDRLERVYVNHAHARIHGMTVAQARETTPLAAVPQADRERLAMLRQTLAGKGHGPAQLEARIERPDGTEVPVEIGLGYSRLEGVRATFAFMRDVSTKAKVEAALRESEERFRRLAEASPDSITLAVGGRYVYANPVALRILGVTAFDQIRDLDPWSRVPPERREAILAYVERLRCGEAVAPLQHRVVAPDGREIFLESSLSLLAFDGVPAVLSCTRDITERLRLQAELMKQDRLASVGILAAGVAHELNNPLAAITMLARKLREDADEYGLSGEVKLAVEQIDDASRRMATIIGDLLFMARPADHPQAHIDVEKIVTSTVALLRAGIPRCPPVEIQIEPLPSIRGYASKLGQALLNVLRNAVHAVEGIEGGAISIVCRLRDGSVEIAIRDNGGGIPPELLPRVTEPFFTTKEHGTGLGLWISQSLIAHHGGKLEVASAPGKGTTVTLSLPG